MTLTRFDPRWTITESEARKLATAWGNWRQHYSASPLDPKTVALLLLVGVLWEVEGTRLLGMAQDRAAKRAAAKTAATMAAGGNPAAPLDPAYTMPVSNVVPMQGYPGGPLN
jgi:hypothetical protein